MDLTTYFSDIDALMHLGAGGCSELNDYLAVKPNKIVLVEADSELAKSLKKKASKQKSVTVLESLVSTDDGEKAFYRYSLPSTSSTQKGNELFSLYPSLKLVREVYLPAQDVKQLISNEFDFTSNNALVIDLPGQEFEILSDLFASEHLNKLDKLIVYLNSEILYEDEPNLADTYQLLADNGFEEITSSIDGMDRKRYVMQRHPLYKQVLDTKAEVKHVMQELTQSELQLTELQAKSKQSKSAYSKQIKTKDVKIETLNSNITELKSELDAAEVAYQKELLNKNSEIEVLTSKVAEQSLALEKVTSESKATQDELHKKFTSKETQLNELSKTLEQTKTEFESSKSALEQELTKARQEHESQVAENEAIKANYEKTVSDKSREVEALTSKVTEQSLALEKVTAESKTTQDELHKKLTSKETQLNELSKTLEKTKTEFESSKSALGQELTKTKLNHDKQLADKQAELSQLQEKLDQTHGWFVARKKQAEEQEKQLAELNQKITQQVEELAASKAQIETLNSQLSQQTSLESHIKQLFDKQTQHLQQATNALGRHITESVDKGSKRVETVLNVQREISSPEYSLEYGTLNIKPELALFLTEKIKSNQYDLVIEFGAGTSTQVMAKLLFNKATDYQSAYQSNYHLEADSTQHPVVKSQAPSAYELPKRLVSFEHSKQHVQKIQKILQANNLQDTVELVYAPLVDVESQGKEYLFYDCKRKIDQIADIFDGRSAKILVLVDGPTSDGESEDRYIALPSLLKSLSTHQLDIVLDDYHRETEQGIAQQWTALLDKRELSYESYENSGAFELSINSKELN